MTNNLDTMNNANEHGNIITNDGVIVYLKQQAYLSGTNNAPFYKATGEDKDGNLYCVRWDIYECYLPLGNSEIEPNDESDMCNWDDFSIARI